MGGNSLKQDLNPFEVFFVFWHNPRTKEKGWESFESAEGIIKAYEFMKSLKSPLIRTVWWGRSMSPPRCRERKDGHGQKLIRHNSQDNCTVQKLC